MRECIKPTGEVRSKQDLEKAKLDPLAARLDKSKLEPLAARMEIAKLEPLATRLETEKRRPETVPSERRKSIDIIYESEHKPDPTIPQPR